MSTCTCQPAGGKLLYLAICYFNIAIEYEILPSNMIYCHHYTLCLRQKDRIFAIELQWILPVNFAIEINKGNRHISAGLLVHMDQIVRFNRETPDDILLTQARLKIPTIFGAPNSLPPIYILYFNSKIRFRNYEKTHLDHWVTQAGRFLNNRKRENALTLHSCFKVDQSSKSNFQNFIPKTIYFRDFDSKNREIRHFWTKFLHRKRKMTIFGALFSYLLSLKPRYKYR